jgi:hypothetical protein
MDKQIFLTKCCSCGKRIAVLTETSHFNHGMYDCNNCTPKFSSARNGIDETFETDLFDEINDEYYNKLCKKFGNN